MTSQIIDIAVYMCVYTCCLKAEDSAIIRANEECLLLSIGDYSENGVLAAPCFVKTTTQADCKLTFLV